MTRLERARGWLREYGPIGITLYLLAASKWGSYVLPGPPYIADMVVFGAIGERLWCVLEGRRNTLPQNRWLVVIAGALLIWSWSLLLFGTITPDALRDAAPYLYAVMVLIVPAPSGDPKVQQRLRYAVGAALLFHQAWVTAARIDTTLPLHMPLLGGKINVFQTRDDFDGTVCGLFGALCVHRLAQGRQVGINALGAAWGAAMVLQLESRAGLLAFIAQLTLLLVISPTRRALFTRFSPRVIALVLIALVPLVSYGVTTSVSGKRLVSSLGGVVPFTKQKADVGAARATAGARRRSWVVLQRYLEADSHRSHVGVGFGPDFLHDSGADLILLNGINEEVRSPHNYYLNTWARIGQIGLGLMVLLTLYAWGLVAAVARRQSSLNDVDVLAMLAAVSIPVAAAVGVVLESPFGALPWFWAIGHLSARAMELGIIRPYYPGRS